MNTGAQVRFTGGRDELSKRQTAIFQQAVSYDGPQATALLHVFPRSFQGGGQVGHGGIRVRDVYDGVSLLRTLNAMGERRSGCT